MTSFSNLMTEARINRFNEVASNRLEPLTAVYDQINDQHNVSACIRSSESFGLGSIHVVSVQKYKCHTKIARFSERWVEIHRHASPKDAIKKLQEQGYTLVGAVPEEGAIPFEELELPKKLAVVFGAEKFGISGEMRGACSEFVKIPTFGFTQSLNLSTASAVMLQHYSGRFRKDESNLLSQAEKSDLISQWIERELHKKTRGKLERPKNGKV
jgi:tRNA (guanosine-2'-O-)-methyltransferase